MKLLGEMAGLTVDDKQAKLAHTANSYPIQIADPLLNLPEAVYGGAPFNLSFDKWLTDVEPVLKELTSELGDGPFFAGEKPGYGETFIWHNIDNVMALLKGHGMSDKFDLEKLTGYHSRFAELPGVKEYLAGRFAEGFGVPGSIANPAAAESSKTSEKCWVASPEIYKDVTPAEGPPPGEGLTYLDGCKLVEMKLAAGAKDKPCYHDKHYIFVIKGGKVKITGRRHWVVMACLT